MIIRNAKVFEEDGTFVSKDIIISDDRFASDTEDQTVIDADGCYAIPGLVDIHFHGCVGHDFCEGTTQAIQSIAAYEACNGVTAICPATMTLAEDTLTRICQTACTYSNQDHASLVGINLEGPFLSKAKKGAQNADYLHKPDAEMFHRLQAASGGMVKLLAVAPEEDGAMEMIAQLKDQVVLSIAHTQADYDTACEAFAKGASHVTHLYNAMPPFTHRAPGVIGAAADAPHCHVELICDGIHIHPSVVRATFAMFGDDRIVLISDSMMATGMPDGAYELGGQAVSVCDRKATLADGTIAGSATNLMDCVRTAVQQMQIPLGKAVKCAAVNPAKAIGIYGEHGSIQTGKYANLVLLDEGLQIKSVILKGKPLPSACSNG